MNAIARAFERLSCHVLLSAGLFMAAPVAAAEPDPSRLHVFDDAANRRLTIVVEHTATEAAGGRMLAGAVRLPRGMMVHRISVDVVDANGDDVMSWFEVSVAARFGGLRALTVLEFTHHVRHLALPRPLGLRLDAGDSLAIEGMGFDAGEAMIELRITLLYAPLDGPATRLAVLPVRLLAEGGDYEWRAPVDGRLMALTGLPATLDGELLLQDAETGAVLWRMELRPAGGEGFSGRSGVVHVGTAVEAGRTYRLTLPGPAAGSTAAEAAVHGLLLHLPSPGGCCN
jgi:hypothetical protein